MDCGDGNQRRGKRGETAVIRAHGVTQQVDFERRSPVSIEAMLDAADLAAPRMAALLAGIVRRFPELVA